MFAVSEVRRREETCRHDSVWLAVPFVMSEMRGKAREYRALARCAAGKRCEFFQAAERVVYRLLHHLDDEVDKEFGMHDMDDMDEETAARLELSDKIRRVKKWRRELDGVLQDVRSGGKSRETSLAVTKTQEAIMWLGMELKRLNDGKSCYPEGYNPESDVVHPVPDGVKL